MKTILTKRSSLIDRQEMLFLIKLSLVIFLVANIIELDVSCIGIMLSGSQVYEKLIWGFELLAITAIKSPAQTESSAIKSNEAPNISITTLSYSEQKGLLA